jgi:predicted transcriptional regulator
MGTPEVPIEQIFSYDALTPTERNLLYIILRNSGDGGRCYLSKEALARIVGVSAKTVSAYLSDMESSGWIRVQKRPPAILWLGVPLQKTEQVVDSKRKIALTLSEVTLLVGLLRGNEAWLTVDAETAQSRRDAKSYMAITARIDSVLALAEKLENYSQQLKA